MVNAIKATLKAWPIITLVTLLVCLLTEATAKVFGIELPEQNSLDIVRSSIGLNVEFFKILFLALVVAPIGEELFFRGLLWRLPLWKKSESLVLGITFGVISAVLFSAAHYMRVGAKLDNAFVALFFFGLAQCYLYRRNKTILSPILNHFLFNFTNLVLLLLVMWFE